MKQCAGIMNHSSIHIFQEILVKNAKGTKPLGIPKGTAKARR